MTKKALNLLQFAAKAGRLAFGTHATEWALQNGAAKLVCVAADISAKSIKELKFKASKNDVNVVLLSDVNSEELSAALGKRCGIVAVKDDSFSQAIINSLGGESVCP